VRFRGSFAAIVAAVAAAAVAAAAPAQTGSIDHVLPLPNGWQPEGIASGPGTALYVGSLANGAVARLDARTGARRVVVPGTQGRVAAGLKADRGRLYVAGGPTGHAYVYNGRTGAGVADVALTPTPTFINDVTLTRRAAWFTDSQRPQLYRLDRGTLAATTVPISGDLQYDSDPATFEANGIVAGPGGRSLLVVQTRTGKLFRVDPRTGTSREVRLTGGDLADGDGLLLRGRTLYAVQNMLNRIAVVRLDPQMRRGRVVTRLTDPNLDVPTTVAVQRGGLYAVNARLSTPPAPDTTYTVVRVASAGR
jgi:sugar lactone lactonase YvrE